MQSLQAVTAVGANRAESYSLPPLPLSVTGQIATACLQAAKYGARRIATACRSKPEAVAGQMATAFHVIASLCSKADSYSLPLLPKVC